jgi:nicotinate-nucleotide adenylyltransferase
VSISFPRATGLARTPGADPEQRHRLGVMGGTFDPIHHGHLVAASEVASRFQLDEVVFVPTGQPWQKSDRQVSGAEDRYLMTVIATASNPRFTVSRVDIDRPGMTYTVDTLNDLRVERGDDVDMYFITGADALTQILTWHKVDKLFDLAHFVGCTRPGVELDSPTLNQLPQDRVTVLEIPALSISSTACRKRVEERYPIWYLVPDGIVQYIAKRGLYRTGIDEPTITDDKQRTL